MRRPPLAGETMVQEAATTDGRAPTPLEYAAPYTQRRPSRFAVFAFQWSLFAPALMLVLVWGTRDLLDEIRPRWLMFAVFQVLVTAAPLTAVALGGVAVGHVRARQDELRGLWLAFAAVVLGWIQTLGLSWLLWELST
jgi:hypothetical protein